jgi:hypothetical protein
MLDRLRAPTIMLSQMARIDRIGAGARCWPKLPIFWLELSSGGARQRPNFSGMKRKAEISTSGSPDPLALAERRCHPKLAARACGHRGVPGCATVGA